VLVAYLLLSALFVAELRPDCVLQRHRLLSGDVRDCAGPQAAGAAATPEPWYRRPLVAGHDAVFAPSVAERLIAYTRGASRPERGMLRLQGLLSERLPPLEDLIVGGQPGAIGTSSAVAVIVGGLFLLYRGVIDFRIPLLIVASAFVALLILPIPIAITDIGPRWSWLAMREASVGWAVAVTFANYQIVASPLMFTAFFLATSPTVRPITRRGRTLFAIAVGVLAAAMQLYVSVAWGPYAALLIVGLFTPLADALFQPKPLA
jgi:Na+-transporting NADH:ubiquinone oxidoreductase subunit NqrB